MTKKCTIISILFCLCLASNSFSAQIKITESRLSELLQQPTVSAIHRDKHRTLWVGTQQGLHRYDGANLTVFDSDHGNLYRIPDSEISDVAEDNNGDLYVATSRGFLLKWNEISAKFDSLIEVNPHEENRFVRLVISKHGNEIWLLSKRGLSVHNSKSDVIKNWIEGLQIVKIVGTPRDLIEESSGNLWIAGVLGILRIDLEQQSLEFIELSELSLPKRSTLTALEPLHGKKLLIGTNTGNILIWNIETKALVASATLETDSRAYISQLLYHEGHLIIGTDRGLYISDINLSHVDNVGSRGVAPSNPNINALFPDGKYVWVGTINGLDILSFVSFELFNTENSGVSNDILAFEEDNSGRLWVGTSDGLYLYDESKGLHSRFGRNPVSAMLNYGVTTIEVRGDTLLLGLIQGGARTVNIASARQKKLNFASSDSGVVTKIIADENDILIATYDQGLFRVTGRETKSYYEDGSLPERSITTIFRSNKGLLLAISGQKLYQHTARNDQYRIVPLKFGLGQKQPMIYSLAQTAEDDILIGTKDHGLFLWTRKDQLNNVPRVSPIGDHQSLSYSTIYGIEMDSDGSMWCSTESGIVKLDSSGALVEKFTTADGLQGTDYTLGASFTSQSGHIYFGGMNGYNRFDPALIEIDNSASPMRLTDIILPGRNSRRLKELTKLKTLQLTHKDYFVTFQFSVLDFIDAEQNQYRYRLDPFDNEWIENGTRNTATYTNLPAGDYELRVQGANSSGIWNLEGITLGLDVLPAPWNTWWAKLIYSVILLCLCWGLLRIHRSYAIERRSVQIAQEMFEAEDRADDDMQEQLEFQDEIVQASYQHSLTTMSLIKDCISSRSVNLPNDLKSKISEGSIKRISALSSLEDFISFQVGGPVINLQKYTDNILLELLKHAPVKPETIITINQVSEMPIPAELASHLAILIFEILENSVQHAFEQDSPANYIQVKLALGTTEGSSESVLVLSFSDNGMGVPKNIKDLAGEGSGITIVDAIVKKLGGSIDFSGHSGTLVTISIPFED